MEFFVYFLIGIINGIFTSGAGQILVFYYIYILKKETKEARNISLTVMPLISIPTCAIYFFKENVDVDLKVLIFLALISIICGICGNFFMKKINSNILNLISGIILVIVTTISLWRII